MKTKDDFNPPGKPGIPQKTTLITQKPSDSLEPGGVPAIRPSLGKKSVGSGLSDWKTSDVVKPK